MKKNISLILCVAMLFAICASLGACSKQPEENTPDLKAAEYENALVLLANCDYAGAKAAFEKLGDYRDAKDYLSKFYYMPTSFEYDLYDKKGTNTIGYNGLNLPIRETTMRADAQALMDLAYDDKGNIIEQKLIVNTDSGHQISTYKYAYDGEGRRISANYISNDGISVSYNYEYDEKGNNVKITYADPDVTVEYFMTYDENGRKIRQEVVGGGNTEIFDISYVTDEQKRIIKEIWAYDGVGEEYIDYTYDAKGNVVKKAFTNLDGSKYTYDYTYDENGSLVHELLTDSDGGQQYVKIEYQLLYIPTGITQGTEMFLTEFWGDRL